MRESKDPGAPRGCARRAPKRRVSRASKLARDFGKRHCARVSFWVPFPGVDAKGIASDNRFTVRALAYIIPGHFAHHVSLLRERYL